MYFKNHAIVAMKSDNIICNIIKRTSGFNLNKQIFSPGGGNIQNTAEFQFGSLVR